MHLEKVSRSVHCQQRHTQEAIISLSLFNVRMTKVARSLRLVAYMQHTMHSDEITFLVGPRKTFLTQTRLKSKSKQSLLTSYMHYMTLECHHLQRKRNT